VTVKVGEGDMLALLKEMTREEMIQKLENKLDRGVVFGRRYRLVGALGKNMSDE